MGFPLYIMLVHFALLILYVVLALLNRILRLRWLGKIINYLGSYLFWNGFIRLYMELYQGLCVASILNTYTADDDLNSPFQWVEACYYCRILGMYLIITMPILFLVPLYCMKRDEWSTEAF